MSIPIEVNLTGEAINRAVADAVVSSTLGEKLKKAVAEMLGDGYRSKLDDVVRSVVHDCVQTELLVVMSAVEIRDKIRAAVATKITDDAITKIVDRAFSRFD